MCLSPPALTLSLFLRSHFPLPNIMIHTYTESYPIFDSVVIIIPVTISHRYNFEGLLKSLQFIVMVTWTNKMAIHSIGSSLLSELWLKDRLNWIVFNTIHLNMC